MGDSTSGNQRNRRSGFSAVKRAYVLDITRGEKELLYVFASFWEIPIVDIVNRLFETQRYCFLGSIDDWMTIGNVDVLPKLVKAYVKHLGDESYYELY